MLDKDLTVKHETKIISVSRLFCFEVCLKTSAAVVSLTSHENCVNKQFLVSATSRSKKMSRRFYDVKVNFRGVQ